jgi:activating signal cointegrator complex subunit 3
MAWQHTPQSHLLPVGCRYVDYAITDVLQMIGRAGRPQFDNTATAVVLVHAPKKGFYRKFMYEPFPVESALHEQLVDHINAEVVGGTIKSPQDALDYLTWTYLYRRLPQNPTFYGMHGTSDEDVAEHLSTLVQDSFDTLQVGISSLANCC